MQDSHKMHIVLTLMLSLLIASCTTPAAPLPSPEANWGAIRPINASVLLLVPEEFERSVYMTSYRGVDERHPMGEYATDKMDMLLRSAFASASSRQVRSESEAMRMITSGNAELRRYDLVIVPRFSNVNWWDRNQEYGFDVAVALEIYSNDGTMIERMEGRGKSRMGAQVGSSPDESARVALAYALDAVKDGIQNRRSSLSRRSR